MEQKLNSEFSAETTAEQCTKADDLHVSPACIKPNVSCSLLGVDNPYPLKDVLKKLVDAANILLHKKNYDGSDYEEIEKCVLRAEEIIIDSLSHNNG